MTDNNMLGDGGEEAVNILERLRNLRNKYEIELKMKNGQFLKEFDKILTPFFSQNLKEDKNERGMMEVKDLEDNEISSQIVVKVRDEPTEIKAPMGECVIVFTDIQGSTNLWSKNTDTMLKALKIHNEVIEKLIISTNGYECKQEGDSYMVSFDSFLDAINFALQIQLEFLKIDTWPKEFDSSSYEDTRRVSVGETLLFSGLRIRIGMNLGVPIEIKQNPTTGRFDYFGPMVNLAARIESLAHGGEILFSSSIFEKFKKTIPEKLLSIEKGSSGGPNSMNIIVDHNDSSPFVCPVQIINIGKKQFKGFEKDDFVYRINPLELKERNKYFSEKILVKRKYEKFKRSKSVFPSSQTNRSLRNLREDLKRKRELKKKKIQQQQQQQTESKHDEKIDRKKNMKMKKQRKSRLKKLKLGSHSLRESTKIDEFPTIPFPKSKSREVFKYDIYKKKHLGHGILENVVEDHNNNNNQIVISEDHCFFRITNDNDNSKEEEETENMYQKIRDEIGKLTRFDQPEKVVEKCFQESNKQKNLGVYLYMIMNDLTCISSSASSSSSLKMVLYHKSGESSKSLLDVNIFKIDPKNHHALVVSVDSLWELVSEKEVFEEIRSEVDPRISSRKIMKKFVEKSKKKKNKKNKKNKKKKKKKGKNDDNNNEETQDNNIIICVIHMNEKISEGTKKRAEMLKKFMANRYANNGVIRKAMEYRKKREENPDLPSAYYQMLEKNKKKKRKGIEEEEEEEGED